MADQKTPDKSEMEPAEGSRGTVESNRGVGDEARQRYDTARAQRGERPRDDEASRSSGGDTGANEDAGGITNRPLDEEIENQRELPSRGRARDPEKDHA